MRAKANYYISKIKFYFFDKIHLKSKPSSISTDVPIIIIFLLLSGFVSIAFGQDANWDLKNYHIYNAYSFLNWRYSSDFFAAGIQSFFNPLPDVLYYLLSFVIFADKPKAVAFFMGLPYGMLSYVLYKIYKKTLSFYSNTSLKNITVFLLLSIGITGASLLPQVGTTFNEPLIACLVILSLYFAIINSHSNPMKSVSLSGIFAGLAVGLKLTAIIYIPGLLFCIALIDNKNVPRAKKIIFFGIVSFAVFILCWGWWGMIVYNQTQNPIFPYFNQFFHSDLIPLVSGTDDRFKPHGIMMTLFYPAYWLTPKPMVVAEPTMADPRFFIGLASCILIFLLCISKKMLRKLNSLDISIILFIVSSYILWLFLFSILRYAGSIEVLIPITFVVLAKIIFRNKLSEKVLVVFLIAIGFILISFTKYPQWGRSDYMGTVHTIKTLDGRIENNSLIVFIDKPMAYVAPTLSKVSKNLSFISITPLVIEYKNLGLGSKIQSRLDNHKGSIYAILFSNRMDTVNYCLSNFGYKILLSESWSFETKLDSFIVSPVYRIKTNPADRKTDSRTVSSIKRKKKSMIGTFLVLLF